MAGKHDIDNQERVSHDGVSKRQGRNATDNLFLQVYDY